MISPQKIADYAGDVADILAFLAGLADSSKARAAEVVVAGLRAALGILADIDAGVTDSADVEARLAALYGDLKDIDAKHDAALAAKFPEG